MPRCSPTQACRAFDATIPPRSVRDPRGGIFICISHFLTGAISAVSGLQYLAGLFLVLDSWIVVGACWAIVLLGIVNWGENDVVCRVGGDEFAVILREMGPAECAQLVSRLRNELAKTNLRRPGSVSLSIGTASFPDHATNTASSTCADKARYEDKRKFKLGPPQARLPFA